jgi:diaminopimelate dehydrogenase
LRLAIVGFGHLGQACAEAVAADHGLELAGIVRRPDSPALPADRFRGIPVKAHPSELGSIDAALLCVPTAGVIAVAHDLLQHRIPIVECGELHGQEFQAHRAEIHHAASRHKVAAIVGAGWDPGAASLLRGAFALLTPKGRTTAVNRAGVSLHHSASLRALTGVRDALCTELRSATGKMQRYVYLELDAGADFERVAAAVRSDPLFLDEDTLVFPVDRIAALEEEGSGMLLERHGTAAAAQHQHLLFEGRFERTALAAQVMVGASRALAGQRPGAWSLFDLPMHALTGDLRQHFEGQWM